MNDELLDILTKLAQDYVDLAENDSGIHKYILTEGGVFEYINEAARRIRELYGVEV